MNFKVDGGLITFCQQYVIPENKNLEKEKLHVTAVWFNDRWRGSQNRQYVIASVIFDKPAMAVDTHVFWISERLGLTTNSKNPLQTELELIKYIPPELIPKAHHWLILHGRHTYVAR